MERYNYFLFLRKSNSAIFLNMRKSWLTFFFAHSKKQYEIICTKLSCVFYTQNISSEIIVRP